VAVYRQVQVSYWQDPVVLKLTPEQKYFYLYLMTNSKTRQCGCYEISPRVIQFETGYNLETIDKLISIFTDMGKIEYNRESCEMLLKNWHKHNKSSSPKVVTCIKNEIETIKHTPFKRYCIDTLLNGMETDPQKEKEKEKEKEEEKEEVTPKPPKPKKIKLTEYVSMTKEQYEKLINDYGEAATAGFIQILDNYKGAKGKTYKDDYRAILNWVIDKYKEKHGNDPARRTEESKVECPVCREKVATRDITAYENYACCKKCAEEGFNVKQAV
jgi:hypothetical protein